MRAFSVFLSVLFFCWTTSVRAETPGELEAKGCASLTLAQTNPDAIVAAAIYYGRATAAYEQAGNEEKSVEMNSFLYWCKKKMTSAQMDIFLKRGEGEDKVAVACLKALDKITVNPQDAQLYFDRASTFATAHANDHLLVAIRFFEVADRFKGTEFGMRSIDRSLKEMTLSSEKGAPVVATANKPVPVGRKPVPAADLQRAAEKTIRDIYKTEFARSAPQDRLDFAKKLTAQADETLDDWTGRYVLRVQAVQLAAQAGSPAWMLTIFDKLHAEYDSDFRDLKKATFGVLGFIVKEPALAKFVAAYKIILDKPDDPAANLVAGKYLCFALEDFDRGLPLLAKAANQGLGAVAKLELPPPQDSAKQAQLADAWWDLGEKCTDKDEKLRIRQRAIFWYKTVISVLSGLNKAKLEKRIGDFEAEIAAASRKPSIPALNPSSAAQKGKVDLLKLIDPNKSGGSGDFRMTRGALEAFSGQKYRNIRLPYKPAAEYDLHATFMRTSGNGDIGFFVVADEQQALLSVCGWQNTLAGFHGVNGNDVDSIENPTKTSCSVVNNKDYKLCVEVRKGSIRVLMNEKELFTYKFDKPGFTNLNGNPALADGSSLGVYCSECTAKITLLEVTNVNP